MIKNFLIVTLLLCFTTTIFAELTSSVDRNELGLDEILTLTVSSDEQLSGKPDWNVLINDFQIISSRSQSQLSIINGKMSSRVQWVLTMMPKHTGDITIPAFRVGSATTQPIEVKVSDFSPSAATNSPSFNTPSINSPVQKSSKQISKDIYLETTITPKQSYVQEQITYTVKLYFKRKIDEAFLAAPTMTNATVTPIGEDIYYSTVKKGEFFRVLERSFVLIPQQSGDYEISPAALTGVIEKQPGDIFDFGNFMAGYGREHIKISATKQRITVKNKPSSFGNDWWLPAKQVSIKERWQPNHTKVHVGDPITREITIQAVGVKGDALPKIELTSGDNLNIYSEPSVPKTETDDHNLIGSVKQKIVMVPTQSGVIKIPEIKIAWWNTTTNSKQVLRLPEHTINVLPIAASPNTNSNQPPAVVKNSNVNQHSSSISLFEDMRFIWSFLVLIFFASILLFIRRRKKHSRISNISQPKPHPITTTKSTKNCQMDLQKACKENDADNVRNLLLNWASQYWPQARMITLLDIVKQLEHLENSANLCNEILKLDRYLYTEDKNNWQGTLFLQVFESWKLQQKNHNKNFSDNRSEESLPPLYLK